MAMFSVRHMAIAGSAALSFLILRSFDIQRPAVPLVEEEVYDAKGEPDDREIPSLYMEQSHKKEDCEAARDADDREDGDLIAAYADIEWDPERALHVRLFDTQGDQGQVCYRIGCQRPKCIELAEQDHIAEKREKHRDE